MKRVRSLLGAFAVLAVIGGTMFAGAPSAFAVNTLIVGPGGFSTIQDAVNAANPGTTIIVKPGTYNESVVITKNGIHIRGAANQPNPVVEPPADPDTGCNLAIGELDGFCIFPPGPSPITNIEIDHLTVQDFPANGIIAFNAVGLNFHDNVVTDNAEYGIARFASSQTQIVNNQVSGSAEAGIYVGDSPNASTLVRRNTVWGNGFGIFLRDSSHGTVTENTATGNCFGILLIDTGEPTETFDWTLVHNNANANTLACPAGDESPPLSGGGIVVVGANHARLTANTATGNVPGGPTFATGGLVIASGAIAGGPDESYIQADHNVLFFNGPPDLLWDGSGNHITLFQNSCGVSVPGGFC